MKHRDSEFNHKSLEIKGVVAKYFGLTKYHAPKFKLLALKRNFRDYGRMKSRREF